ILLRCAIALAVVGALAALWRAAARREPPEAAVAPVIPIGWWNGEGNGDDRAGGHPLTQLDGVAFAAGEVGRGFNFDGKTRRVILSDADAFNFGPGMDFSIEAW